MVCRGAPGHAPAELEPDLDASLIDLVAEVERLQAGVEALSRGTPSPNPDLKPSMSCQLHSPRARSPHSGRELGRQWAQSRGSQLVRSPLAGKLFWVVHEHRLVIACTTRAARGFMLVREASSMGWFAVPPRKCAHGCIIHSRLRRNSELLHQQATCAAWCNPEMICDYNMVCDLQSPRHLRVLQRRQVLLYLSSASLVQVDAWDSSSLFEENDVVSLISEQDWDV